MSLNAATITELSRSIAEDYDDPDVEIMGVSTHGGSDRVELLVSVTLPDAESGRQVHMLNLSRTQRSDFERDFRSRLQESFK